MTVKIELNFSNIAKLISFAKALELGLKTSEYENWLKETENMWRTVG